ncbi:MAG TPA: hypothetical protein VIS76_10160 [Pseudomonadales bacterium]
MQQSIRFLVLGCLLLAAAGCEPQDRRPGLWLSGEIADTPKEWSFVADYPEIFVETRPWYGIPFSVTTVAAARNGKLYVPSIYDGEKPFPGNKYWNSVIADNPEVRLKIGGRIYEMRATWVRDIAEYREGARALADKYESWARWLEDEDSAPTFVIIRMEPRG